MPVKYPKVPIFLKSPIFGIEVLIPRTPINPHALPYALPPSSKRAQEGTTQGSQPHSTTSPTHPTRQPTLKISHQSTNGMTRLPRSWMAWAAWGEGQLGREIQIFMRRTSRRSWPVSRYGVTTYVKRGRRYYAGVMAPWDSTERAALVALLRCTPSEKGQRDLVQRITEEGSALALLRERLGPGSLFGDPVEDALSEAARAIDAWEREGIIVLTMGDECYPHRLSDVFDRPPLLFARGECLAEDQGIAVVGSRSVSEHGRRVAGELAERLVERGLSVVSGLAAGVDTVAHRAAIRAGGRTVAVIGTGIKRAYPPENRDLHREIAEHGVVLSQFWPEKEPDKFTFPRRNGTMSGYSLATIIVEAGERSGTRIQARKAVEHGRPVILMHPVVDRTDWGRETAGMPDVHVARDVDEAMSIVDTVVDRPNEIERLLIAATTR